MHARQRDILARLRRYGRVQIRTEAAAHKVAEMTVRRDLQALQERGLAIRVHGGAVLRTAPPDTPLDGPPPTPEQTRIAAAMAARLHGHTGTIMLSTGGTTLELARQLARADAEFTVLTNSLPVAAALFRTRVQVLLPGGFLRASSLDLVGPVTERNLGEFHVDMLITGCDGADAGEGFFTSDLNMAAMEQKSVAISEHVTVLAASRKFRRRAFARFAALADVDTVITDTALPGPDADRLTAAGVELLLV